MKIKVVREADNQIETLNIPFPVTLNDKGETFNVIQGSDGMDHYFYKESGLYDGWGMGVSGTGISNNDVQRLVRNIEEGRQIEGEEPSEPALN